MFPPILACFVTYYLAALLNQLCIFVDDTKAHTVQTSI